MEATIICTKCGIEKTTDMFEKKRRQCKQCRCADKVASFHRNPERMKRELEKKREYHKNNLETIKAKKKIYRAANDEHIKEKKKEYYEKNKEYCNAKNKEWRENNPERTKELATNRWRERYATEPEFKIKCCLRARTYDAINRGTKSATTMELLGCTIDFYRDYLEFQFDDKMTWENQGSYWHIDHIIPCSAFDLTDPEEQRKCFNFNNTRPLEASENLRKGDKLDWIAKEVNYND